MKTLILSLALVLPLAAESPAVSEVQVNIDAPSPAWKLKIDSIHKKDGKLLIVTRASDSDGIAMQKITEISDSVKLPNAIADIPRKIYIVGAEWNTSEDIKSVTNEELDEILAGGIQIYQAKKEITTDDFLELSLADAEELAKSNKLHYRIVEVDGKPRPMTMDLRMDRFNFHVKDGKVIKVTKG